MLLVAGDRQQTCTYNPQLSNYFIFNESTMVLNPLECSWYWTPQEDVRPSGLAEIKFVFCMLLWWKSAFRKQKKAFFRFGSISAFQGNLSPVSTSSVVECRVYPVLLYIWCRKLDIVCKLSEEVGMLAKEDSEAASESTVSKYCSLCSSWLAFHPFNLYG